MGKDKYQNKPDIRQRDGVNLKADCEKCFGLCCVALYFSVSDGFPVDKAGGEPCPNLQEDFRCKVHGSLTERGLKGCRGYECFGAGPRVSQGTYTGQSWRQVKESADEMFECYLIMKQLHELLWYLKQALGEKATFPIKATLISMFDETEKITGMPPKTLIKLDIEAFRQKVNALLIKTSELTRVEAKGKDKPLKAGKRIIGPGKDLIGLDLRDIDLRGANLRGAYLIGADMRGCSLKGTDLIGADLRDTDIRGTDLSESIFLTQIQLNVAKGDSQTKIPDSMSRPDYWLF